MLGYLSDCLFAQDWVLLAPSEAVETWREQAPRNLRLAPCRGDDVLRTVLEEADALGADGVVRVCADLPLVDASLIDAMLVDAARRGLDYAAYVTSDGKPTVLREIGLSVEWAGVDALRRLENLAAANQRTDFMAALRGRPDEFQIRLTPLPKGFEAVSPRAPRSHEQQWEDMDSVLETLTPGDAPSWSRVSALLGDGF